MPAQSNHGSRLGVLVWIVMGVVVCVGLAVLVLLPGTDSAGGIVAGREQAVAEKAGNGSATATPWQSGNGSRPRAENVSDPGAATPTPVLDQWMEKNWEKSDKEVTQGLLALVDSVDLPLQERSRAMEHLLNLLKDEEYGALVPVLEKQSTPHEIAAQVYADIHNRSERTALETALVLLRRQEPEIKTEAKELLAHWVDLDPESDAEAIRMQAETRVLELKEAMESGVGGGDSVEAPPPADEGVAPPLVPMP